MVGVSDQLQYVRGTCATCRSFDVAGKCRLNPPGSGGFPSTTSGDWCNDYQRLPTPSPPVVYP